MARALQVDIEFLGGTVRAVTRQVSSGGFGALLGCEPRVDDELRVALRVPGGQPVHATARVRDVKRQDGTVSACFQFTDLDEAAVERLEAFVFDAILEHLRLPGSDPFKSRTGAPRARG